MLISNLREQVFDHLELELRRQQHAGTDEEKDEWHEQIRLSVLKERESERQHSLSIPYLASCSISRNVASPDVGFSNTGTKSDDGIVEPTNRLSESSRLTTSTAMESESLESCTVDQFLGTSDSFDSTQTATSLNIPKKFTPLPMCAVCNVSERTHISIPCMHLSFCTGCAQDLRGSETPICPICQRGNIELKRVYL
mmetsp:Transcript_26386/g.54400  ORF Transcript_26386/g.54400 Transcript_26386/m.54400 type:complete len:197 (+) Transcript_26386:2538-3128(+)